MLVSPRTRDCLSLFLSTVSCQVYLCLLPVSSSRNVSNTLGTKSSGKCHVLEEMKLFIVQAPSLLSKNAVDSADSTLPESSRLQFMLLWNDFWRSSQLTALLNTLHSSLPPDSPRSCLVFMGWRGTPDFSSALFTIPFCLLHATSVSELKVLLLQLTPSDTKFPQLDCLFLLSL